MATLQKKQLSCSRRSSRFETLDGVWVYWRCAGLDDVSRVRDLSVSGMFLNTEKARHEGEKAKIDFLVQEGQIRTEAVVQRLEASNGLGLKFIAISEEDRPRLAALLMRLRSHRVETHKRFGRDFELA